MKVYLCGPIHGCTDEECKDWRDYIKASYSFDTIDPMRRDYRGREAECYREVVELDKRDIRSADVVLVNCPKPSHGTSMEILYAWSLGIPVVVVCPAGTGTSPWLRYHSLRTFHTFAEAIGWIEETL